MSKFLSRLAAAMLVGALLAGNAAAQLLPGVALPPLNLPLPDVSQTVPTVDREVRNILGSPEARQAINPTLNSIRGLPPEIVRSGAQTLLELRSLRLRALIRENRAILEAGERGLPIRRGIVVVVNPRAQDLLVAQRAGFTPIADELHAELGLRVVELRSPNGSSARSALALLARIAPGLDSDVDPIFEPAGGPLAPVSMALATASAASPGRVIGMVDGGVASHPSLAGARIEQNGFAGAPKPTGHGTAVASLLVGNQGRFRGAAAGSRLFVADVYGGNRAAGSATAVVKALAWLARNRPAVINVSLVGPQNKAVARAVQTLQSRGIQIVAAVGNDGPAAPPQYPASYPGVIAVTGVDARGRALPEAGRAAHLDFAAPGADMAAALPGSGYARVRGTSFAAPLAAARLFHTGSRQRLATEARRGKGRVGEGIVCFECRVEPSAVGAK